MDLDVEKHPDDVVSEDKPTCAISTSGSRYIEVIIPQYITGKSFVFKFLSNWGKYQTFDPNYGTIVFIGKKGDHQPNQINNNGLHS